MSKINYTTVFISMLRAYTKAVLQKKNIIKEEWRKNLHQKRDIQCKRNLEESVKKFSQEKRK